MSEYTKEQEELQKKIIAKVIEQGKARKDYGILRDEADFMAGAMAAMTCVLPDGLAIPPQWYIPIIRGESILLWR